MREVSFNEHEVTITIEGVTVYGFPYEGAFCPTCGRQGYFYETYSAVFCPDCNAWLEGPCSDPECPYCAGRPANPLPLSGWSSGNN